MNRFLDLEAGVGEESEDGESEQEMVERDSRDVYRRDVRLSASQDLDRQAGQNEFDLFMDELLARAEEEGSRYQRQRKFVYTDSSDDMLLRRPRADDYPLWRVECKIGMEEAAVMSILRRTDSTHSIRSAFSRGSIRGHIYVECRMDSLVKGLLSRTTGVRATAHGIQMKEISPSDYIRLLTMKSFNTAVREGEWVRVKKGLYRGDEGIVRGAEEWGVKLLLVPRVDIKPNTSNKRKSTTVRPDAQLIDDNHERADEATGMGREYSGSQAVGDITIEHGLIIKDFDFSSVLSNISDMSYRLFSEFNRSKHPLINNGRHLLRPKEWIIDNGDRVLDSATNENGTVTGVFKGFAEVLMDSGTTRQIIWSHLQKHFGIGEEVTITSGFHAGSTGWVVSISDGVASVVKKSTESESSPFSKEESTEHLEIAVNCLKSGPSALTPSSTAQNTWAHNNTKHSGMHPWIGVDVMVNQQHHVKKGMTGKVTDVLRPKDPQGPPRIIVQATSYDPHSPFTNMTLDVDSVVTQQGHRPLKHVKRSNMSEFLIGEGQLSSGSDDPARGQTPMPEDHDTTSAWNPTDTETFPGWDDDRTIRQNQNVCSDVAGSYTRTNIAESSSTSTERPVTEGHTPLEHDLLHPKLAGASIKAYIYQSSSEKKEASITINDENGYCCLRTKRYHVSEAVPPKVVTPKHPNPAYDNGLVVVIKGDHVGKYGRRIHHVKKNGVTYMILGIVEVKEGQADRLTGEVVEMASEDMCVVDESKAQKKVNADTMKVPRQKYREDNK